MIVRHLDICALRVDESSCYVVSTGMHRSFSLSALFIIDTSGESLEAIKLGESCSSVPEQVLGVEVRQRHCPWTRRLKDGQVR